MTKFREKFQYWFSGQKSPTFSISAQKRKKNFSQKY